MRSNRDNWIIAFGYPPEDLYLSIPMEGGVKDEPLFYDMISKVARLVADAKLAKAQRKCKDHGGCLFCNPEIPTLYGP